jgi:hypothetical protein
MARVSTTWDTIIASVISDNSYECRFSDCSSGAGIYNNSSGVVTINNSTIVGNSASAWFAPSQGGGIYNFGVLLVRNSTLNGNRASVVGAIYGGGRL